MKCSHHDQDGIAVARISRDQCEANRSFANSPGRKTSARARCLSVVADAVASGSEVMWHEVTQMEFYKGSIDFGYSALGARGQLWHRSRYRTYKYRCRNRAADVPQYLDESRGVYILRSMHLKSEIAQRELSDLCRKSSVN